MLILQDLNDFSVVNWYKDFKEICIETSVLEIPESLVKKLSSGDTDYKFEEVRMIFLLL